jgi:hypothetical protein
MLPTDTTEISGTKPEAVYKTSEGVPTFDEMEATVKRSNEENREYGTTLFRIIEGKNKTWQTLTYGGSNPIVMDDGEVVFNVNIQDQLETPPKTPLVFPITLHSHPTKSGYGHDGHILPSGMYVENSPRGEYGDLFVIDEARLHGHKFLNPLIIMTDIGITFPIGVSNSNVNKDHEAIALLKERGKRSDKPYATTLWSVWENGEYEIFERDDDNDRTLSDSLKKGYTVMRLTEKDASNYRKEVYLLTVSWPSLKKYLKDQNIDEETFWARLALYDSGLPDFVDQITNNDLPKELNISANLLEFISHFEE